MANCPKCGKPLKYELRSAGTTSKTRYYRTGVKKSWFIPSGRKTYTSNRKMVTVGFCPNCGYHQPIRSSDNGGCAGVIILVIAIILVPKLFSDSTNKKNTLTTPTTTAATVSTHNRSTSRLLETPTVSATPIPTDVATTGTHNGSAPKLLETPKVLTTPKPTDTPRPESVWAFEPTTLDKFKYYIDGDCVYLTDWNGSRRDEKVWIAEKYIINDKVYRVGNRLEDLFAVGSVSSVIIPEGIEHIKINIFNSSGIKYVYLPRTLLFADYEAGAFLRYFHGLEKLYYGGSENDWKSLIGNIDRGDIDVKQIIFNASVSDLIPSYSPSEIRNSQITITEPEDMWAKGYTDLSSFDFYLDGNSVVLKKYLGNDERIWLSTEYEYEGNYYQLGDLAKSRIYFRNAVSIIIPEGIKTVSYTMFSSNDLKYLFIPKSITKAGADSFYRYLEEVDTLYYGGSEKEWLELTDGCPRSKIKAKEIVFNVDYKKLIGVTVQDAENAAEATTIAADGLTAYDENSVKARKGEDMSSTGEAETTAKRYVKIRKQNSVNVRSLPDSDSERVGTAKANTIYLLLDVANNGWFYIQLDDDTNGYISPKLAAEVDL